MSDLEDLIRDSMRLHESQAPDPAGLVPGVAGRERARRRRRQGAGVAGTVLAVVAVLLAAGPVGHVADTSPRQVRPAGGTVAPTTTPTAGTTAPTSAAPSSAVGVDPSLCGPWSAETSAFSQAVAKRYGSIESCFLYGRTWVITTDGLNGAPGYVGVDQCNNDIGCLSGAHDHGDDLWAYYPADRPGSVRLYAQPVAGQPLQVTVGGRQETFDVDTYTFGPQAGSSATATTPATRRVRLVRGHLLIVGGPGVRPSPGVPGKVTFHRSDGADITVAARGDGAFVAVLPHATYTVTGTSPNYRGSCHGNAVTVTDATPTAEVAVACDIR
ncbi:MAG: hypothetical protein QOI76_3652 [Frankiales bacterium]|jgi:hypothetical protein|nr:hypothetical protein [Frankiales bacterium]